MATSSAASSGTAAACAVGGTGKAIRETVVGSHMMEIQGFSGTKDLGVGKSIKSSTFNVGGHGLYIECYPCGVDDESAGRVTLFLCLSAHKEQVEAETRFYSLDHYHLGLGDYRYRHTYNAENSRGQGTDIMERAKLESLIKDDCIRISCDVYVVRDFPSVPPLDLHRPLSDFLASGMPGDLTFQVGGELLTVQRGQPGTSALVATSPTFVAERTSSGSHVLTIDGYSKTKKMFRPGHAVQSDYFFVRGHRWDIRLYPGSEKQDDTGRLPVFLRNYPVEDQDEDEVLKVRFELTLLTIAREIISSAQFCYAFPTTDDTCRCYFPFNMETVPLLGDSFHIKCDVNVVEEITPMQPPELNLHFGHLLSIQVGTDVEFEVCGELFSAHKCVLATRSMAFMAKFFGPSGKGSSTTVTRVQIGDMKPRVFKALLYFIYTDALPELQDEDKVVMVQGLLVAADKYAMERLKLICSDKLCCYINDARTAINTMDLADKHGCRRLREACKKFLMDHFAKDAP